MSLCTLSNECCNSDRGHSVRHASLGRLMSGRLVAMLLGKVCPNCAQDFEKGGSLGRMGLGLTTYGSEKRIAATPKATQELRRIVCFWGR